MADRRPGRAPVPPARPSRRGTSGAVRGRAGRSAADRPRSRPLRPGVIRSAVDTGADRRADLQAARGPLHGARRGQVPQAVGADLPASGQAGRRAGPGGGRVWREETWPAIRTKAKAENGEVLFADQVGVRSDQVTGRTWGEQGKTPVVRRTGNRFSVNAMSAISTRGRMHFMVFTESFDAKGRAGFRDEHPARGQRPPAAFFEFHGQFVKEPVDAVLLDLSESGGGNARSAIVPTHRCPRAPQDVPAVDLVPSAWNRRPGSALAAW